MSKTKWRNYKQTLPSKLKALRERVGWSGYGLADLRVLTGWILSTAAVIVSMSLVISTGPDRREELFRRS